MSKAFVKNVSFSILLGVSLISMTVGGLLSANMMMEDGMMRPCPFMDSASICNMTPLEHVSQWQQMFTTTSPESGSIALLALLSSLIVFSFVNVLPNLKRPRVKVFHRYRYRERVFDPLKIAFARGILNPKLY